jgi:hypothetical protein
MGAAMIEQSVAGAAAVECDLIRAFLADVMAGLRNPSVGEESKPVSSDEVPAKVFDMLVRREFCYLSKGRASVYREGILSEVASAQREAKSLHFYYDIGGGYHASTQPGKDDVSFDIGLGELLLLRQVSSFVARIAGFHPIGVRVSLVIDNMCALMINDIPVERTLGYCKRLRTLIQSLDLDGFIDLLVESEHVSVSDFSGSAADGAGRPGPMMILTRKQHDNVERFLGRSCGEEEARERSARYETIIEASERLMTPLIRGIHMTQRATERTICFRSFPGGDSRIQCGEVALTSNGAGKLYPVLLTSSNIGAYSVRRYAASAVLASGIPHVTYAERLGDQACER